MESTNPVNPSLSFRLMRKILLHNNTAVTIYLKTGIIVATVCYLRGRIKLANGLMMQETSYGQKNDGFAAVADDVALKPRKLIDRYGYESGSFESPEGIPYEMRSLAPGTELKPYHVYEVLKPIDVLGGKMPLGLDNQVEERNMLKQTNQELLVGGYIKEVFK